MQYVVQVGYCADYPIIPDQHVSYVVVGDARSWCEASLTAAQTVAARRVNVTSTHPVSPALVSWWPILDPER